MYELQKKRVKSSERHNFSVQGRVDTIKQTRDYDNRHDAIIGVLRLLRRYISEKNTIGSDRDLRRG